MTVGAAEILAAESSNVDRVAVDIKARGAEPLIGIWASPIVTQQVFVCRNPFDIFDRKLSPTIGANGLAK